MNFYSPVSSTRRHSIAAYTHNIKNQNPGRQSREMGKSLGMECNFEEVCFEPGTDKLVKNFEYRVSGGSEFQSRSPMTEKAHNCQAMI